jgi:hypothetical protein
MKMFIHLHEAFLCLKVSDWLVLPNKNLPFQLNEWGDSSGGMDGLIVI